MKPLILTLIFAVIATTIGAGWMITQFHSSLISNSAETDQNLIAYKQLGQAFGKSLDGFSHQDEFIAHWKNNSDIDISFQDRSDFPVPGDITEAFEGGTPLLLESEGELSLHVYMRSTDQVMSMLSPIKERNPQSSLNVILTLLFYLMVIAVLLAWLYPLIKRLVMLQKAAKIFGTGDLTSRISPSRYSYIATIENDFNRMANQIEKLVNDNQLLSRAVSHNLKTPITRLRMGIDVLEEATVSAEKDGYFKRINKDLDEMQSLVETLLQYSSLDEFEVRLQQETIDLCKFLPEIIENEHTGSVRVTFNSSHDRILVQTDPKYLAMSLVNILSNAVQHAKSIVEVRVNLQDSNPLKKSVAIIVEDDGVGISEEELADVTKPFWRGSSDPEIKGHGMGLAIVARIAEWLQADLLIQRSSTLGGASVSLFFGKF